MLNILVKIKFLLLISMTTCMLRVIITFICKLQVGDFGCREAIGGTLVR